MNVLRGLVYKNPSQGFPLIWYLRGSEKVTLHPKNNPAKLMLQKPNDGRFKQPLTSIYMAFQYLRKPTYQIMGWHKLATTY